MKGEGLQHLILTKKCFETAVPHAPLQSEEGELVRGGGRGEVKYEICGISLRGYWPPEFPL